jgi:hypothetical protein
MSSVRVVPIACALAAAIPLGVVSSVRASAPPVGALPAGPTASVVTRAGELVAVALPLRRGGLTWRIARPFDSAVVNEVTEADVRTSVVLVFRALHTGDTKLRFALTRGETSKAFEAKTFSVHVR